MKELDHQAIKYDSTKNRTTLEVNLTGNVEAVSFIYEGLNCLIDSCQKKWEDKDTTQST